MIDDKASAAPRPEVINRVVAWHNRHPLARRITAAQVRHVGLVLLPFAAPGDAPALSLAPAPAAAALAPEPAPPPEVVRHTAMPSAADEEQAAAELMGELAAELAADATAQADTAPAADPRIEAPHDEVGAAGAAMPEAADASPEPAAPDGHPGPTEAPSHDEPPGGHGEPTEGASEATHPPEPANAPLADAGRRPWWRRWRRASGQPANAVPLFTEDLLPELGVKGLIALALRHGLTQLPPGERWQWRSAALDRPLQDQAAKAGLTGRADRVLLTAALDDGTRRHRLLIGAGLKPHIQGPRLWDQRRLAALAGVGLVCLSVTAWALGRHAGLRSGLAPAAAAASAPAAASAAASAASGALAASQAPASVSATSSAASAAALPASAAASASASSSASSAHTTPPAAALPASAANPGPHDASASAPAPSALGLAALSPASAPPSIAPNLRPQLARAAQAQSTQRFALVSEPIRSGAPRPRR